MGIEQLQDISGPVAPNFIAVCLEEAEDRAQQPGIWGMSAKMAPVDGLVSLLGSGRED